MTITLRWLTSKHLSALVGVAALALALLVVLPIVMASRSLEEQAEAGLDEAAVTNAMAIDTQVEAVGGLVSGAARRASVTTDPLGSLTENDLDQLAAVSTDIRRVALSNPQGQVIRTSSLNTTRPSVNISDRSYFKQAIAQDTPYVSDLLTSRLDPDERVIAVAQSVRDSNNEVKGMLIASIRADSGFQRWADSMSQRQHAAIAIYDSEGNVIAGNKPQGTELHRANNKYLVSQAEVPNTGWTVAAYSDRSVAFSPVHELRDKTVPLAVILAGLILAGAVALARQMRARGRAEEYLTKAEANVSQAMDAAEQMMFELEIDGRIIACNATVKRLTGFDPSVLQGQFIYDAIVPEHRRDLARRMLEDLQSSSDPSSWRHKAEGRMLTKQGDELIVDLSIWASTSSGRTKVYLIISDITKRKRFERDRETVLLQQRRLVEELRQSDKTRSDFVSTVSHELRTPLTSIVGYLEMLTEGYGGDLSEQHKSMLAVVDRNSRRLLGLIEDLLTLSRIESRNFRVEHFPLDLGHLVVHSVQAMIPSATEKSLELDVDVDPRSGVVHGDQNQLERVMINLLGNAVKFTPEGGAIAVRLNPSKNGVLLEVADTGIGISAEEQTRLFSRFFRSAEVQERAIQGTGLGLAIVKSIVTLHEGTIEVISEHGVGTTVRVWFPVAQVPVGT